MQVCQILGLYAKNKSSEQQCRGKTPYAANLCNIMARTGAVAQKLGAASGKGLNKTMLCYDTIEDVNPALPIIRNIT